MEIYAELFLIDFYRAQLSMEGFKLAKSGPVLKNETFFATIDFGAICTIIFKGSTMLAINHLFQSSLFSPKYLDTKRLT